GNIYVCEALYRARLSPERAAGTLALKSGRPSPAAERLVFAIRAVLDDAIAAGGSTLRDYRHADGSSGAFQERFDVYDRAAQRCHRDGCGGTIKRVVHSGRSTFFCSRCQR
ncbi:MAG: zinc finger domain-containing protein, partial [Hyphomicrobium sp.]